MPSTIYSGPDVWIIADAEGRAVTVVNKRSGTVRPLTASGLWHYTQKLKDVDAHGLQFVASSMTPAPAP